MQSAHQVGNREVGAHRQGLWRESGLSNQSVCRHAGVSSVPTMA
jgi:hypothetical protein